MRLVKRLLPMKPLGLAAAGLAAALLSACNSPVVADGKQGIVLAHAMTCCMVAVTFDASDSERKNMDGPTYWRHPVGGAPAEMVKYTRDPLGAAREEIRLAKAAGIDGFGLFNNGCIKGPLQQFAKQTEAYWQAATEDGTFKLYPEIWTLANESFIEGTAKEFAYLKEKYDDVWLRIDGKRVVMFAYQENTDVEKTIERVLAPLGGKESVYVVIKTCPRAQDYTDKFRRWTKPATDVWLRNADAVIHWSGNTYGDELVDTPAMAAYAKAMGKELWLRAVPAYFVLRGNIGPFAWERLGMAGYYENWRDIIAQKPRVAYLLTWNDSSEDSGVMADVNHGHAFLELTKFFSSWYKNGVPPAVGKEQVLMFHHPQLTEQPMKLPEGCKPCVRHNSQSTPPTDYIGVVTMLKEEAVVKVELANGVYFETLAERKFPAGVNFWLIYHPLKSADDSALKNGDEVNVPDPYVAPVYPAERSDFFVTKLPEALKPRDVYLSVERDGKPAGYFRSQRAIDGAAAKANLCTIGDVFELEDAKTK